MKKGIVIIVLVVVIGVGGCFLFFSNPKTELNDTEKLSGIGYKDNQIELILKDKDALQYALNHEFDSSFMQLITHKDYQMSKFKKYMDYQKLNPTLSIDDVVLTVNQGNESYTMEQLVFVRAKYYLANRLSRYLDYQKKHPDKKVEDVIRDVNSNIDYDFYTNVQKTDLSKGKLLIANKFYQLGDSYVDKDLVTMGSAYSRVSGAQLNRDTYQAFCQMSDAAKKEGLTIVNVSAYRSYASQNYIYNNYVANNGKAWADSWSARPGYSEHQTGLAMDVGTLTSTFDDFEYTKEFVWLKNNAHHYGFILRYPKDRVYITGYNYEPWHYRYVGEDVAKFIYENNLTFEEYYAYYVEKDS